jgi:hypothetical protein
MLSKNMFEFGLLNILLGELRHDIRFVWRSEWNPPLAPAWVKNGTGLFLDLSADLFFVSCHHPFLGAPFKVGT